MIMSALRFFAVSAGFLLQESRIHRRILTAAAQQQGPVTLVCLLATGAVLASCGPARYDNKTEREWLAEFRDGSTDQRVWAAGALARMDAVSEDTRRALQNALDDSSGAIAVAAAKALAPHEDARRHRSRILALLWQTASDTTAMSRLSALEALGLEPYHDARSVPVLATALQDHSPGVRATAAVTLGALGKLAISAEGALHDALADSNEMVRHESRDALNAITGERLQHREDM